MKLYASFLLTLTISSPIYAKSIAPNTVGPIARIGKASHCMAFAISKNFLQTSSDCVKIGYDDFPLEKEFIFKGKHKNYPVSIEAVFPSKKMAFLYLKDPVLSPLKRGFSDPKEIIYYDQRSGRDLKEKSRGQYFVKDDILYHDFSTFEGLAGAPILNKKGDYMGMHLGTGWHKGKYWGIGSYHGKSFDVFKTVSYEPDVAN